MKQNHSPRQYASYEVLIFELDLDLQGPITISSQNGRFDLLVACQGQKLMKQNDTSCQHTSYGQMTFHLDLDL